MVNVFVIATAFQEYTVIVKYCPFSSTFGACSLSSISYEKKDSAGISNVRVSERCAQINFYT